MWDDAEPISTCSRSAFTCGSNITDLNTRYVDLTHQCLHFLNERCVECFEQRLRGIFLYLTTPPVPCQDAQLEGEFHTSSKGVARRPLTRTQQTCAQDVVHHGGMRI